MIKVFSDCGSYNNGKKNPNKPMYGSFGVIALDDNDRIIYSNSKVFPDKTNNYCELIGLIDGLVWAVNNYPNEEIVIYSDSEYAVKGASERLAKWVRNGWRLADKSPVTKNRELWEIVNQINNSGFNITYKWVRGHQGKSITKSENYEAYYQEIVDSLAVESIKRIIGEGK